MRAVVQRASRAHVISDGVETGRIEEPGLVVLVGGICIVRGRFYYLALFCCLVAMLNFNHLCCIPGLVVGLWGILSLARDEVRPHFDRTLRS